jgi:signal transduction histidine kinase
MHGGYLTIESIVGTGTTVSIFLPVPADEGLSPPASARERAGV